MHKGDLSVVRYPFLRGGWQWCLRGCWDNGRYPFLCIPRHRSDYSCSLILFLSSLVFTFCAMMKRNRGERYVHNQHERESERERPLCWRCVCVYVCVCVCLCCVCVCVCVCCVRVIVEEKKSFIPYNILKHHEHHLTTQLNITNIPAQLVLFLKQASLGDNLVDGLLCLRTRITHIFL